jgi:hypothetical protein
MAAQHCPDGPGQRKGLGGVSPRSCANHEERPSGDRLVLRPATGAVGSAGGVTGGRSAAQDPQRDSRHVEQGLRPIRRANGFMAARVGSIRVRFATPPGTAG